MLLFAILCTGLPITTNVAGEWLYCMMIPNVLQLMDSQ